MTRRPTPAALHPVYATARQAHVDAHRIGQAPLGMALFFGHLRRVIADPRTNSDLLLIVADALRADAPGYESTEAAAALRSLADVLTNLAPSRADPL